MTFKDAFEPQIKAAEPFTQEFIDANEQLTASLSGTTLGQGDYFLLATIRNKRNELEIVSLSSSDEDWVNKTFTFRSDKSSLMPHLSYYV